MKPRDVSAVSWPLLAVLAGGLALRLAVLALPGHRWELSTLEAAARMLALFGTHGLYGHVTAWNPAPFREPPGIALLILLVERIYEMLRPARSDPALLETVFKALPILADIASVAIVYAIVVRYAARTEATFAAAIAAFAPWTWPLSAIAAEPLSIATMFLLLSLDFALEERFTIAWLAVAAGALVSPIALAAMPVLFVVQLRGDGLSLGSVLGPCLAVALACAAALPFSPLLAPTSALAWLAHLYGSGVWLTSYSAANVWSWLAKPVPATHGAFRLTFAWCGLIAAAIFEVFIVAVAARRIAAANSKIDRSQAIVAAWFVALLVPFVVATGMHESALAFPLAVVPAIWTMGVHPRRIVVVLTATFAANLILAIVFGGHAGLAGTIALRCLAVANVAMLGYALLWIAWREPTVIEDWGGLRVP